MDELGKFIILFIGKAYTISGWNQETQVLILSLFLFSPLFFGFSDFVDNSLFGGEILYCSIEIQSILAYKYIAYSLALCYLSLVTSGIWNKIKRSSVNVAFVFVFTINFCYYIKRLLIIYNFLTTDKTIVSNWCKNLDDKLIKERAGSILQFSGSRLTHHRS